MSKPNKNEILSAGESGEHRQTLSRAVPAQGPVGADGARRDLGTPSERCWRLWHFLPVPYPGDVCHLKVGAGFGFWHVGLVGFFPPLFSRHDLLEIPLLYLLVFLSYLKGMVGVQPESRIVGLKI